MSETIGLDELTPAPQGDYTPMDPRLQRIVARARKGQRRPASSSTSVNEIAVVARVSSVDDWLGLSEVKPGVVIPGDGGDAIVTGRIPVSRIEAVREMPFVLSLKAAQPVQRTLGATTADTGASPKLLPKGTKAAGGKGVVVGVVDFGCDFAHRNFRLPNGTTRVEAIWNQSAAPTATSPFGYGRVYERAQINAALKKADPYAALGYGPDPDNEFEKGSHGTHVMDIAAGNGRGSGVAGIAPQADLIFVELASSDIPWAGKEVTGKSFGDSVQLLEAVQFIIERAAGRPCAINLSLGTNGGPHDGTTLVEQGIDRLVRQAPNRAVIIAASNSFGDGIHAAGTVAPAGRTDIPWNVIAQDVTANEMELWYSGADKFAVELIAPNGTSLVTVEPGKTGELTTNSGRTAIFVSNRLNEPNNQDNTISVFLERGLPAGRWVVRLHGRSVADGKWHAWIERDDAGQSTFFQPLDNSHTLGSISTGHETIVVGSYDAHKANVPLSWFSSAGPTRDGREKPELSAPGHAVLAAHSRTGTGVISKSGTSMAAPAVTGIGALVLAQAKAQKKNLAIGDLRQILLETARPMTPAAWDARYGKGRIAGAEAVKRLMAGAAAPPVKRAAAKRAGGRS
ncbi:MAG: S8 family peptidase [Bryobacteraceae bacterium]|nr:S8 family peptidase [Bryobacteraceae bacterium]